MNRSTIICALLAMLVGGLTPAAQASEKDCGAQGDLEQQEAVCNWTADEARDLYKNGPTSGFRYRLSQRFHVDLNNKDEYRPIECPSPPDTFSYELHRSRLEADPPVWEYYGTVCLGSPDEVTQEITVEMVEREFTRLTWPAARLTIQPPDGETLVNLPTIFLTRDTTPLTQTVTLLGQTVAIQARPTQWTWHWAQQRDHTAPADKAPHTTTYPGSPHPHATITHTYRTAGVTVHPSVDVTYQGRFRVNAGEWHDIPTTHTVTGTADQTLDVLQARPTLVQ